MVSTICLNCIRIVHKIAKSHLFYFQNSVILTLSYAYHATQQLLALALLRLYRWWTGGLGLKARRLAGGAVLGA
jgi:hypothetical protein